MRSCDHPAVVVEVAPELDEQVGVGREARRHEERVAAQGRAVGESHPGEPVVADLDARHRGLDDPDRPGEQLGPLLIGQRGGRREQHHVVAPLPHDLRVRRCHRAVPHDAEPLVADLVAVAVGAVQDVARPAVAQPGDVGELIAQAGRHEDAAAVQRGSVRQSRDEGRSVGAVGSEQLLHGGGHDLGAVGHDLCATCREELGRGHAVAAEEPLHLRCRRVAGRSGVDDDHAPPSTGED